VRLAQAADGPRPSRKSRQKFQTTAHMAGPRNPSVADRSLEDGEASAKTGKLGEDHSECTSDQQVQLGVVEEDRSRSPPHPTRAANSMESAAQRRKVVDSPSRRPGI
jgi:hypothetical protein